MALFCGVISDPICRDSNSRPSSLLSTWFLIPIPLALALALASPRFAQVVNQGSTGRWLGWAGLGSAVLVLHVGLARHVPRHSAVCLVTKSPISLCMFELQLYFQVARLCVEIPSLPAPCAHADRPLQ